MVFLVDLDGLTQGDPLEASWKDQTILVGFVFNGRNDLLIPPRALCNSSLPQFRK